ncbi:unnamed protein product [Closterium sp. NIES-53]
MRNGRVRWRQRDEEQKCAFQQERRERRVRRVRRVRREEQRQRQWHGSGWERGPGQRGGKSRGLYCRHGSAWLLRCALLLLHLLPLTVDSRDVPGGHPAVYIVRLRSAPAIPAYVGGIPGFPATASPAVVAEAAAVAAARGNGKRVRTHWITSAADAEENDELDDDDYNEDDKDGYGDDNDNTESDVPAMAGIRVSAKPRTGSGGAGSKEVPRGPVPATRGVRVNVQAAHVKAFARMLVRQQQQVVAETRLSERNMLYSYKFAANGFAARLTQADVRRLKRHAMVADVTRSYGVRSATTYTPRFLQLPGSMWASSGGGSRAGEGVVIGVVDTGIWPEHPSFRVANSSQVYPRPPRRWAGKCVRTRDFPASRCTRKLVGARFFSRAYEAQGGVVDTQYDFRSPRDADGHGTWCAG